MRWRTRGRWRRRCVGRSAVKGGADQPGLHGDLCTGSRQDQPDNITIGNVVSPSSGLLATIVSQDPMYVLFPVASRTLTDLQKRYAEGAASSAVVVKLRLPDGRCMAATGRSTTSSPPCPRPRTQFCCGHGSPIRPEGRPDPGQPVERPLMDGAFVTVMVEGIEPVMALGIPRKSVLSDQQGSYVYVVGRTKRSSNGGSNWVNRRRPRPWSRAG